MFYMKFHCDIKKKKYFSQNVTEVHASLKKYG